MTGYSDKPLAQKLGLKAGSTLALIDPPADYGELLAPLPAGVRFCTVETKPDLIHYSCTERVRLAQRLPVLRKEMRDDTALWVSWPKKSAAMSTTITEA